MWMGLFISVVKTLKPKSVWKKTVKRRKARKPIQRKKHKPWAFLSKSRRDYALSRVVLITDVTLKRKSV